MTYIENIFVCMAAPLLMAMLCVGKKRRALFFFCIVGMGTCLLGAYLNTFFAQVFQADAMGASTQIAPLVEETIKLLPLLFYLVVFEPDLERFSMGAVVVAASFATFENVCYLTQHGAEEFFFLLLRGFGAGAMHICTGGAYGCWIKSVWKDRRLRAVCLLGILCLNITFHAIYNLLVSMHGALQYVGYAMPLVTVACGWLCYLWSTARSKRRI